jgi:hypothetical protein
MDLKLAEEWSGEISGTNSGDFFLQINCTKEGKLSGLLRINDPTYGLNVYKVAGQFDGIMLNLVGSPTASDPNTQLGNIRVRGALQPSNSIEGNWESAISTGGKFSMTPHSAQKETLKNISSDSVGENNKPNTSEKTCPILAFLGMETWKIFSAVAIAIITALLIKKFGLNPLS